MITLPVLDLADCCAPLRREPIDAEGAVTLAEAFKAQRERSEMTFDELAAATGLARQTLFNLSAGRVNGDLRTWAILAKAWDVSLDELIAPIWE